MKTSGQDPNSLIDDIVIGERARLWAEENKLFPSAWALPPLEVERILGSGLRITCFQSPATALNIPINPFKNAASLKLVIFDILRFGEQRLSRAEVIAVLLHEIGHVVNIPQWKLGDLVDFQAVIQERSKEGIPEFEADDYARHCGYAQHALSGLEKTVALEPREFDSPLARRRIERLRNDEPVILNFGAP